MSPQVEAALRARGTDPHTASDLTQDVAIRLMASEVAFEDDEHVLRWCHVVARRLAMNHYRDQARLLVGAVPETAGGPLTDDVVTSRLAIDAVVAAMGRLSEREREAIVGPPTVAATRQAQVADAVRRHRARRRLRSMVSGVLAWVLGVPVVRRVTPPAIALVAIPIVLSLVLLPRPHHSADQSLVPTPPKVDASAERMPLIAPVTTAAVAAPVTRRLTVVGGPVEPRTPSPLSPLHGTQVDGPAPILDRVAVRERMSPEPLVCIRENPLLPDACLDLPRVG